MPNLICPSAVKTVETPSSILLLWILSATLGIKPPWSQPQSPLLWTWVLGMGSPRLASWHPSGLRLVLPSSHFPPWTQILWNAWGTIYPLTSALLPSRGVWRGYTTVRLIIPRLLFLLGWFYFLLWKFQTQEKRRKKQWKSNTFHYLDWKIVNVLPYLTHLYVFSWTILKTIIGIMVMLRI